MLAPSSARWLFGLFVLVLGAPAAAQDLAAKVATILAQADAAPVESAFEFGLQILDNTDAERTDPIRDVLVAAVKNVGEKGRLAAAVALQKLKADATYGKDLL